MKNLSSLHLLAASALAAPAQPVLSWFTLDAGGGAQASASYVLNATLGQGEVDGPAPASASYRIVPGFWALENLGPATGLPELTVTRSGANVILSWTSPATGFVLEHTDALDALPGSWSNTTGVINDNGSVKTLTVPHNLAKRFYRLRKPSALPTFPPIKPTPIL